MKKLWMVAILMFCFTVSGCRTRTDYGQCKGLVTQSEKDPKLKYEVSTRNVVLSVIFSATLLWPIVTASFWIWCPVERAQEAK